MTYDGMIIEGPKSGIRLIHNANLAPYPGKSDSVLRFVDVMGHKFWVIGDSIGNFEATAKAVEILTSREWLEVAYKQGFRDAADYENLNRVSDADLEAVADQHWQMFKE